MEWHSQIKVSLNDVRWFWVFQEQLAVKTFTLLACMGLLLSFELIFLSLLSVLLGLDEKGQESENSPTSSTSVIYAEVSFHILKLFEVYSCVLLMVVSLHNFA